MPGVMESANCDCGYEQSVMHGIAEAANWALLVVAYTKDDDDLISIWNDDAVLQGLEIVPKDTHYQKFRCPKCKKLSLSFHPNGNWD